MKSQKLNDAHWRITAPDGRFADLILTRDWWNIMIDGQPAGAAHSKRFNAKVEAERLLSETA